MSAASALTNCAARSGCAAGVAHHQRVAITGEGESQAAQCALAVGAVRAGERQQTGDAQRRARAPRRRRGRDLPARRRRQPRRASGFDIRRGARPRDRPCPPRRPPGARLVRVRRRRLTAAAVRHAAPSHRGRASPARRHWSSSPARRDDLRRRELVVPPLRYASAGTGDRSRRLVPRRSASRGWRRPACPWRSGCRRAMPRSAASPAFGYSPSRSLERVERRVVVLETVLRLGELIEGARPEGLLTGGQILRESGHGAGVLAPPQRVLGLRDSSAWGSSADRRTGGAQEASAHTAATLNANTTHQDA